MLNNQPMGFLSFHTPYEDSEIVLFGIPYDGTTSFRPGTRFGPSAMRMDSLGLETYSPYFDRDLQNMKLHDAGDIILPFGNTEKVLDKIYIAAQQILADGKKPIMLGGEHLVSYPAVKAVHKKYPDLHILHFDAHTDLRDSFFGETLSHATVIRRIWDLTGDEHIHQFCIRSGEKDEFTWAKSHTHLEPFTYTTLAQQIELIQDAPVYITIDLDVLDPSVFPGTGTPEPGGITFHDMLKILAMVKSLNIVAADIVELSPHYDPTGISTAAACKILRELTLLL